MNQWFTAAVAESADSDALAFKKEKFIRLRRETIEEMFAHARAVAPQECCGLLGGGEGFAETAYPLRNVARDATVAYEAAPEELFEAQRRMRARAQSLVGIYHSHPRSKEPAPSSRDVRLAFYPSAVYFIIGFDEDGGCVLRAFRISESEARWERIGFETVE